MTKERVPYKQMCKEAGEQSKNIIGYYRSNSKNVTGDHQNNTQSLTDSLNAIKSYCGKHSFVPQNNQMTYGETVFQTIKNINKKDKSIAQGFNDRFNEISYTFGPLEYCDETAENNQQYLEMLGMTAQYVWEELE